MLDKTRDSRLLPRSRHMRQSRKHETVSIRVIPLGLASRGRIIGDRLEQVLRDGFAQPLQGNHVQRLMKRMLSECRGRQ